MYLRIAPIRMLSLVGLSLIGLGDIANAAADTIASRVQPGKCVHKKYGGWNNGNPIHLWDCNQGIQEMKTWTYDSATGHIRSSVNPQKCLHKKYGGWNNGNPIHLWDCNQGTLEMKTWTIVSNLPSCEQVETLGNNFRTLILSELNNRVSGSRYRATNRKTLQINSVSDVSFTGCVVNVRTDVTLERKIRHNANGSIALAGEVTRADLSTGEICVANASIRNISLSNTTSIGENFYRRVANRMLPDGICFDVF